MRVAAALFLAGLAAGGGLLPRACHAVDLGVTGPVFEIIEEDFRLAMLRLVARQDWSIAREELLESAKSYTANLPGYFLPKAESTVTRWKDAGMRTTEDIYLPWVDWENGSVFEPSQVLIAKAGTYLNALSQVPAAGIERLFIFDGTDPDQLAMAVALMKTKTPQLNFMMTAGDVGPLAAELNMPVYHAQPTDLSKLAVRALPTLIGFGRGAHLGHVAVTEINLPSSLEVIQQAWYGLGDTEEVLSTEAENQ